MNKYAHVILRDARIRTCHNFTITSVIVYFDATYYDNIYLMAKYGVFAHQNTSHFPFWDIFVILNYDNHMMQSAGVSL